MVRLHERHALAGPRARVAQQPDDARDVLGILREEQARHSRETLADFDHEAVFPELSDHAIAIHLIDQ
ncbi:hypothetical protein Lesp02_67810 [Lentzea sp. NBRC 105346]|nr:hypothetical protein Lesp02_67810 [Lentzea sp. NBRC 105346]